jgi:hypothetical protein
LSLSRSPQPASRTVSGSSTRLRGGGKRSISTRTWPCGRIARDPRRRPRPVQLRSPAI